MINKPNLIELMNPVNREYEFLSSTKGTVVKCDHILNEKVVSIYIKKSTAYISCFLANYIRNQC